MKKYIHIKKEDRDFIAKAFGITPRMVYSAIHYESDSELAQKVRRMAITRGGIVMVEAPEWEVLYDADGYMRCYRGDILLEFSKAEPVCDVYRRGALIRRFTGVKISDIQVIQDWAASLQVRQNATGQNIPTDRAASLKELQHAPQRA